MQIAKTNSLYALPLLQEPARGQQSANQNPQNPLSQNGQASLTLRSVEDVKQAERMLNQVRARGVYAPGAEDARQQRAASAYRSLQQQDERAYVSEVLGIDVYA